MSDEVSKRRAAIDAIDDRIVALLNERAALAVEIGGLKGMGPIYDPAREAVVLKHVAESGSGPLCAGSVKRIYTEIMSACRAMEQRLSVAYLGPEGTFSEMAVAKHFGSGADGVPCMSIDDIFRKVESGVCQHGVVPIENSTEGGIGRTMDLLVNSSVKIGAEIVLRVRQNLMAKGIAAAGTFARVFSHPQSFGQCARWLDQNMPLAERIAAASNAEAARRAADDAQSCAIGPELAASRYGLEIIAPGIEDDARNMTRFLVLGMQAVSRTGADRTSLVMSAANKPGAVLDLIAPFGRHQVSMTRIESRPARTGQWEYLFFIDLDGHLDDAPIRQALDEVAQKAPFLKIFGSYPAAQLNEL